jgi:flagellar hook-associated protein 2
MTGLQSSVGLISGIDYTSLVDQLIAIDAIPKDNLTNRTELLKQEETALSNMLALFLTSSYMIKYLNSASPFKQCEVSSSNAAALTAVKNGTPIPGSYTFTPLQVASAQQTIAKGVASDTEALGKTGTISIGKGWSLENDVELNNINGGAGFTKGSIRITDGSGTRATIDLKKAVTMKDVVNAINDNDTIDVVAEIVDDHLVLTDLSGGDMSKFVVQEVSGGSTAASLGIANLHADANGVAVGNSIYRLGENMSLSLLNDGNGLVFDNVWQDIVVNCKDGSTVNIDFNRLATTAEIEAGAPEVHRELTVGDLIDTINNSKDTNGAAGKVRARISDDGKGLVIEDTTSGSNFTTLTCVSTNPIFRTLGLTSGDYTGTGIDFLTGLADTAANPAKMTVQDKAGNTAVLEFSTGDLTAWRLQGSLGGSTYGAIKDTINTKLTAAGVNLQVSVNGAGTGFDIVDTSSGSGSVQMTGEIASRLGLDSATQAGIASVLAGAAAGQVCFTDKTGTYAEIDLTDAELASVTSWSDLVTMFNNKLTATGTGIGIDVQLNATGDGIKIVDTTGSTGSDLAVSYSGGTNLTSVTRRLGIDGTTSTSEIDGTAFGTTMNGGTIGNTGIFETRNLLGSMDTVLMSTLNGGYGFANAHEGVIEVQDRAGNTAEIVITQDDLKSMQTLNGTVGLLNEKLTNAGIGITVKMNDSKTGLQLVDTTGSLANNLVFKDRTTSVTTPTVPGVDAVSADDGSGGTAVLTLIETDKLNGWTFDFTTTASNAGYNAAGKEITFYIPPEVVSQTGAAQDTALVTMMQAQIGDLWQNEYASDPSVPAILTTAGIGAAAIADAASGGKTKIDAALTGSVAGVPYVPATTTVTEDPKIASSLGLTVDAASSSVGGKSLNRQIVSYATKLTDLNAGKGVTVLAGKIVITDSAGKTDTLTIDTKKIQTVGDVINAINGMSAVSVHARINDNGDGIVLEDFAGGDKSFSVSDADTTSKFASSLGIAGTVVQANKDADGRLRINASQTHQIDVAATDSLDSIRKKINDLNIGYTASIVNDGSSAPYRLSISGNHTGAAGGFNVDLSLLGLTTETMSEAKDAMIVYGDGSSGLVLHSSTNTFKGVVTGIDLTVTGTSAAPVTITSASSNSMIKTSLSSFVENYNKFKADLNTQTYFVVSESTGVSANILWNSAVAKSLSQELDNLLLSAVKGIPGITSLADLGITMRKNVDDVDGQNSSTGTLIWDETKFQEAWDRDPEAVQKFFFEEKTRIASDGTEVKYNVGFAQKMTDLSDRLVGTDTITGSAQARLQVLAINIDKNEERVAFMEQRLEWKRQFLLSKFYAMEQAMATMSSDMSSVSNIATAWSSNYSTSG